jgi:hypothetical protein
VPLSEDGNRLKNTVQWAPGKYDFYFERTITAIDGNTVTINAPIVHAMDRKHGAGAIFRYESLGRVYDVGIERLRIFSEFGPPTEENPYGPESEKNTNELHGWDAILLNRNSEHTWVRNVETSYFGWSAVYARGVHATIRACKSLDQASMVAGGRRYPFAIDGQRNLVQNCESRNGRREFVTQKKDCGSECFCRL